MLRYMTRGKDTREANPGRDTARKSRVEARLDGSSHVHALIEHASSFTSYDDVASCSQLSLACTVSFFFPVLKRKRKKKKKKKKKESFYQRVKARTSSPPLAILSSNFAASRVSWKRIYPPKLGRNTRGHTSWMYSGNDSFHQLSRFEGGGEGKKNRGRLFATKRILSLKHFLFVKNRV